MEELLSLKWNNHQSTFIHVLGILREKQLYTDTTLACDGKFYSVHKLVLSTCSDYFSAMLDRTNCKNPVIVLKDINSEHLEALLDYMYLGEVNVRQSDLAALIKAAECLHVKGLAVPDDDPLPRQNKSSSNQIRKTDANGSPPAKRKRSNDGTKIDSRPVRYDMPISLGDSTSKPVSPAESSSTPVSPLHNKNTMSSSNDTQHLSSRTTLKASHTVNQDDNQSGDYQTEPVVKVEVDDYGGNDVEALGIDKTDNFKEEIEDGISTEEGAGNKLPLDISTELPEFLQQVSSGSMQCSSFDQSSHSSPNFEHNNVQCWKGDGSNIGFPYQNFLASEESGLQTSSAGKQMIYRAQYQTSNQDNQLQEGDTPYKDCCPFCLKTFTGPNRGSNLKQHINIHTGEKLFSCTLCSHRSNRKNNLKSHMKFVHGVDFK